MNQNGQRQQRQTPETYKLPAQLVGNIYQLLGQVAAGQAARVFVALENEIARQNDAHRERQAEPVEEQEEDNYTPTPQPSEFQ